jgi:hypothetical protein
VLRHAEVECECDSGEPEAGFDEVPDSDEPEAGLDEAPDLQTGTLD